MPPTSRRFILNSNCKTFGHQPWTLRSTGKQPQISPQTQLRACVSRLLGDVPPHRRREKPLPGDGTDRAEPGRTAPSSAHVPRTWRRAAHVSHDSIIDGRQPCRQRTIITPSDLYSGEIATSAFTLPIRLGLPSCPIDRAQVAATAPACRMASGVLPVHVRKARKKELGSPKPSKKDTSP